MNAWSRKESRLTSRNLAQGTKRMELPFPGLQGTTLLEEQESGWKSGLSLGHIRFKDIFRHPSGDAD